MSSKKRSREAGEIITKAHKQSRIRRMEKYGNTKRVRKAKIPVSCMGRLPICKIKGRTFDEEYKEFGKSKGRRGLDPDPDRRLPENYMYLNSNRPGQRTYLVPIQELMSKPIQHKKIG